MKRVLAIFVLTGGLLFGSLGAGADHSWGGFHWSRASSPFSVTVVDSVTAAWDASFTTAMADWSASSVLDLTSVAGSTTKASRKQCTPSSGKIRVCNAAYGRNGWLGVAEIWLSGNHIAHARTRLNDSYFNKSTYNTPAWRAYVMCQEIGHDFGLDHQDETFGNANLGTCMDYTNDPTSNQHPNIHDYEHLETIYAHLDGTSQASSAKAASPSEHPHSHGDARVSKDGEFTKLTFTIRPPR